MQTEVHPSKDLPVLDRIEIEEAGPNPEKVAAASRRDIFKQNRSAALAEWRQLAN